MYMILSTLHPPARSLTVTFVRCPIFYSFPKNQAAARSSPSLFLTTLDDEVTTLSSSTDNNDDEADNFLLEASDLLDDDSSSDDDDTLPASYISAQRIASLRLTHQRHPTDTGSPEYQIAGMTERIAHLTSHLKAHPKDFSTRRGLVALVNKRRRLLNYLYSEDESKYVEIVGALGIRHKVPGSVPSKEDEYGEFPSQKGGKKGKSKMKK